MAGSIGPLRHLLTIEAASETRDEGGGAVTTWTAIGQCWARITAGDGTEPFTADAQRPRGDYVITLRAGTGVTPAHRLREQSRVFAVLAVVDREGRGRFLDCTCTIVS